MRKIKEVLRLGYEKKLTGNQIAACCSLGRSTVQEYFRRFERSSLAWPLPEELSHEALEQKLFPKERQKKKGKEDLNYAYLLEEMKRPNVTLALLWEEYKREHPNGYQYSYFSQLYRKYASRLNYSMRQEHRAGEKTFNDFGEGLKLMDRKTGKLIPTKIFVAVWGASNYTFAKAVKGGETLENWLDGGISSFEYFGCCPKAFVPDNPKSVVSRACRYEPEINPAYAEFARHYEIVVFPARPAHPKDKAKAENGVKLIKRWILAKLRNRIFYSLEEMNAAIWKLLEEFNRKPMKQLKKSRQELFEALDKPNALPLPEKRFEIAEWKKVKVNIDYHVAFDDHYYSVPYTFIHQELEIRATTNVIEIWKSGLRVCSHQRRYLPHKYSTVIEHMPPAHQHHAEWSPSRILSWAEKLGPAVRAMVERIIERRAFPEQAYRACLGVIRLEKQYSAARLNAACDRALRFQLENYQAVKNILLKGLDRMELEGAEMGNQAANALPIQHTNIRGGGYYAALNMGGAN